MDSFMALDGKFGCQWLVIFLFALTPAVPAIGFKCRLDTHSDFGQTIDPVSFHVVVRRFL